MKACRSRRRAVAERWDLPAELVNHLEDPRARADDDAELRLITTPLVMDDSADQDGRKTR